MSGTIKFYHPDETLVYHIKKCFGKIIYLKKQHYLVLEIESTDDLDHVDEDSIQSEFPEIKMGIDDFPVSYESIEELYGNTILIPFSSAEIMDDEGEIEEVTYTWIEINEEIDLEATQNKIHFSADHKDHFKWTGFTEDWTNHTTDLIKFSIQAKFSEFKVDDRFIED